MFFSNFVNEEEEIIYKEEQEIILKTNEFISKKVNFGVKLNNYYLKEKNKIDYFFEIDEELRLERQKYQLEEYLEDSEEINFKKDFYYSGFLIDDKNKKFLIIQLFLKIAKKIKKINNQNLFIILNKIITKIKIYEDFIKFFLNYKNHKYNFYNLYIDIILDFNITKIIESLRIFNFSIHSDFFNSSIFYDILNFIFFYFAEENSLNLNYFFKKKWEIFGDNEIIILNLKKEEDFYELFSFFNSNIYKLSFSKTENLINNFFNLIFNFFQNFNNFNFSDKNLFFNNFNSLIKFNHRLIDFDLSNNIFKEIINLNLFENLENSNNVQIYDNLIDRLKIEYEEQKKLIEKEIENQEIELNKEALEIMYSLKNFFLRFFSNKKNFCPYEILNLIYYSIKIEQIENLIIARYIDNDVDVIYKKSYNEFSVLISKEYNLNLEEDRNFLIWIYWKKFLEEKKSYKKFFKERIKLTRKTELKYSIENYELDFFKIKKKNDKNSKNILYFYFSFSKIINIKTIIKIILFIYFSIILIKLFDYKNYLNNCKK